MGVFTVAAISLSIGLVIGIIIGAVLMGDSMADPYDKEEDTEEWYDDWNQGTTTTWAEAFNECADMVDEQPTIEPQRKKGKWIDRGWSGDGRGNSWHEWECSECKHITKGAKWDFCPTCGADMTEKSEEPKRCDTCKHEKARWFSRCADCSDYELWEAKDEPS